MNRAKNLSTHLALLRGINVGGKNMLPMKSLAEMFAEAGCTAAHLHPERQRDFRCVSQLCENTVRECIVTRIEQRYGLCIPVLLRSAEEMIGTTHHNPFMTTGTDQKLLYVMFLADLPNAENVKKLDPDRSPPDLFCVHGREIYLHLPNGPGRTKLTNAYFDSKLGTVSTARNWRTVLALTELMLERHRHAAISGKSVGAPVAST